MENEKPKRKNKPGQGRPFKMKIWVEALKKVVEDVCLQTNLDTCFQKLS